MRSAAALLVAVALSVTAAPIPPKDQSKPKAADVASVWRHRHFDAAHNSVHKRAESPTEPGQSNMDKPVWKHRHYDTAIGHHDRTRISSRSDTRSQSRSNKHARHHTGTRTDAAAPKDGSDWPFPWRKCGPHGSGGPEMPTSIPTSMPPVVTETPVPSSTPVETQPPETSDAPLPPETTDAPPPETTQAPPPPETTQAPPPPETTQAPPPPETTQVPPPPETTQAPSSPPENPTPSNPNAAAYLDPHNAARAQHNANPVGWDDNLAQLAQQWVNGCTFEHSGGSLSSEGYGENLAAGTGEYQIADAVTSWVNEGQQYDPNNPEQGGTGHFTQVVWKSTTMIGCAYADCPAGSGPFDASFGDWRLHSCMYTPPGNFLGQYPENVDA